MPAPTTARRIGTQVAAMLLAAWHMVGLVVGLLIGQILGGLIAREWGAAAPFWFAFAGSGLTLAVVRRSSSALADAGAAGPD